MKELIVIEDDEVDLMTIQRSLHELEKDIRVTHFENGLEAIQYLENVQNQSSKVILLDINTPVMNGIEFLDKRMKMPGLAIIPVVVMTTSRNDSDKMQCYQRFASSYFVKPVDYPEFVQKINVITQYWEHAELIS